MAIEYLDQEAYEKSRALTCTGQSKSYMAAELVEGICELRLWVLDTMYFVDYNARPSKVVQKTNIFTS